MKTQPALACLIAGLGALADGGEGDLPIGDFEEEGYGAWLVEGTAFGAGPAHGTLPDQQPVSGFEGRGLVNSYLGGDAAQGTLTSPPFTLARRYVNLLVGGGNHPGETCVELLVDEAVVRTASGCDDERLDWQSWEVDELRGRRARLRIADRSSAGWGHVNVDSLAQSDERRAVPLVTAPAYAETYRPQFHFTPRTNWMNDPNGLVHLDGEYHLFFQHNPAGLSWGNMTWGHAVSPDLVHWTELAPALRPDERGTIFSGSAVVDWQDTAGFARGAEPALVALYTAAGGTSPESQGQPFTQCLAFSTDRGRSFTKYEHNPVLPHRVGENRDPKVVWHAPSARWILALYEQGESFALFTSPDLKAWVHLQDLTVPGGGECPDFFELPVLGEPAATRWVFTAANGRYLVGRFDGRVFTPEGGVQRADWGKNFYAVQTYSDAPDGRRIQLAWMNGGVYPRMPFNQQMSFPCELELVRAAEGLRLTRLPVRELAGLRARTRTFEEASVADTLPLAAEGELFDVEAVLEPGAAREVGLRFRDAEVVYDARAGTLSCLGCSAELPLVAGRLALRVLIDRTSLEVFGGGGRVSLTSCFLPRGTRGLELFARGAPARARVTVHELRSAWRD